MSLASVPEPLEESTSGDAHGSEKPVLRLSYTEAEMPKSASAGRPCSVMSTLLVLMSRCTMPLRCAVASALARLTPMSSVSSASKRRVASRSLRLPPGAYSKTM